MELVSAPKYFKYPELKKGQVLIQKGKYLESKQGKFGVQHYFEEIESSERKVLNSSGQLNYLVDSYLAEGDICKIVYEGKVVLDKGAMKGKEAHNFQLYLDKPTKTPEVASGTQLKMNIDGLE